MTVEYIIPCICCEQKQNKIGNAYSGMPILLVTGNYNPHVQFYDVQCPKCKRGGMFQDKSAYIALKRWNNLMRECYRLNGKEIPVPKYLSDNTQEQSDI